MVATMGPHVSEVPRPDTAGRCRVLVADDNKDLADALARLLRLAGCDAEAVYGGREAVAAALAHRPDVIVLDIGLPGMNGYQVAERLRGEEGLSDCFIIAISGYSLDMVTDRAAKAAFNDFLVKPLDYAELLARIPRAS